MFVKEFCAENFTQIPKAIEAGANRIELCDNLAVGGTTVSLGVLKATMEYCKPKSVPVMAMIRPRGGNFVYDEIELKNMLHDISEAKNAGVDGVVFGALTKDKWLDEEALTQMIAASEGLQRTFHMAFDEIPMNRQFEAIDWLSGHGMHRILTHGGPASQPLQIDHLKQLIQHSNGRIVILPGGKITAENCEQIAQDLNVHELHGTKIVGEFY